MYGRKLSLRGQFSFATRFLKEKGKESIYEKPYLDLSRPQMHQDPPVPEWPSDPPPVGQYPPNDPNYHIYIFAPGIVGIFVHGPAECGEAVRGSANVTLQAQHNKTGRNIWSFTTSDDRVRLINIEYFPPITEYFVNFDVEVDEVQTEVDVQICARVYFKGDLVRKIAVPMFEGRPLPGWEGTPQEPPIATVLPLEIWTDYVYPEECTTLTLEACTCVDLMTWDEVNSAETIGRNDSAVVYVTGDYATNMTWTVTGTGFWFDEGFSLTTIEAGKNVTLYTDGTACGTAMISVCGAEGQVRCTTGGWVLKTSSGNTGSAHTKNLYYGDPIGPASPNTWWREDHYCCDRTDCEGWGITWCPSNQAYNGPYVWPCPDDSAPGREDKGCPEGWKIYEWECT